MKYPNGTVVKVVKAFQKAKKGMVGTIVNYEGRFYGVTFDSELTNYPMKEEEIKPLSLKFKVRYI